MTLSTGFPKFAKKLSRLLVFTLCFSFSSSAQDQNQIAASRKVLRQAAPVYPALARNTRTYGTVKLDVTVDRSGAPKSIEVVGGNPVLVKAAQESVNRWKWVPASADTVERVELKFQPD